LTDEELVEICKQGEEWAFEEIIKKYHVSLYNYIYNLTNDKELARDLVQDTFLKMINNIQKYRSFFGTKFSTWLFTIARNTFNDQLRRNKNKQTLSLDIEGISIRSEHDVEKEVIICDQLKSINQLIEGLPKEEKAMVYLDTI
jgi:RNA polymerase sigma-70 factor (ECF subfamily)